MVRMSADVRYREWTGRPARPVRYGLWQRWADRRNGRRDGKSSLPLVVADEPAERTDESSPVLDGRELATAPSAAMVPADAVTPVNTPYVAMLACLFDELATHEAIGWEDRAQPLRSRLETAREQLVDLRARLDEHQQRLKAAAEPLDEQAQQVRRAVEIKKDRPAYLSRGRRLVQHARAADEAEQRYLATLAQYQRLAAEVLDLTERVDAERRVAAARVRRVHAHVLRRVAGYWRYLMLFHEQGRALNTQLRPVGPQLPSWVLGLDDDQKGTA
ncbi:hypothetical protein ACFQO7_22345 [Catellatospora aurea]|uniref:Uncharacterized protein n=1 Tax=Catellatospora aurea TaxID=1337874 RepID=A0ABW2H3M1_9ACTN